MGKLSLIYEFDNEDELREYLGATNTRTVVVTGSVGGGGGGTSTPPVVNGEDPPAASGNEPSARDVDGDGMPYDENIHATPPSFTSDGLWRAKRGAADEAKAARAAFKAKGGTVTPPANLPPPAAAVPVTPPVATAPVAPPVAAPVAPPAAPAQAPLPPPMAEPVSLERLYQVIEGAINGMGNRLDLGALYLKHTNARDGLAVANVLAVNETARANLYKDVMDAALAVGVTI